MVAEQEMVIAGLATRANPLQRLCRQADHGQNHDLPPRCARRDDLYPYRLVDGDQQQQPLEMDADEDFSRSRVTNKDMVSILSLAWGDVRSTGESEGGR
jgi:hypothetical protein